MIDNKNIPDAEQSWAAAEKMLDRHFRKRRHLIWFISLLIPAMIVGFIMVKNQGNNVSENNIVSSKNDIAVVSPSISPSENNKNVNSANDKTRISNITSVVKSNINSVSNIKNVSKNTNPFSTGVSVPIYIANDISSEENNLSVFDNQSLIDFEEISFLEPLIENDLFISRKDQVSEIAWPKLIKSVCSSHIVWETSIYGGVHSINKNLSGGSEWKNYLQHRKYEEDAILAPSVGVSLAANINSFTVSIGAEYSVYGEKTKYYPYSNQLTITDNSTWNTFIVNYIDTDTAYIFGNQRFIETIMQRTDSNYVFEQDTSEEYKYDQRIAQSNGVNRLYYVEIPLEVSYCLNKGRAGFGLSGGISPALLVQEKGYYIRYTSNIFFLN